MSNKTVIKDFGFPYKPYDIQVELMNVLYDSLEKSEISILESPTGTGKSLSIICSISKWIEDYKTNEIKFLTKKIIDLKLEQTQQTKNSEDWLKIQLNQISTNNKINDINSKLELLEKHLNYCQTLKQKTKTKQIFQQKNDSKSNKRLNEEDKVEDESNFLVQFDENQSENDDESHSNMKVFQPKVYYCSRTHSQLSQFINEFKKTKYSKNETTSLMLVPLSSRANFCINSHVNKFSNLNMINEKCNDLKNSHKKCSMFKQPLMTELSEEILANVWDIEEIVTKSRQIKACPYFSTKKALTDAEIVLMPYNILLNKNNRKSYNIDLKDSIVIIDEAHNLIETITNIHTVELKCFQILNLAKIISIYVEKYHNRFSACNLMFLKQIMFILKQFLTFFENSISNSSFDLLEFNLKMNIENINLNSLTNFIDQSRLPSKLHMFSKKKNNETENLKKIAKTAGTLSFLKKIENLSEKKISESEIPSRTESENEFLNINTLYLLKDFLLSLSNCNTSGKILLDINLKDRENSSIKYTPLSPGIFFKDILSECRSVILCGGTMKPFEDYFSLLFKPLNIPLEKIKYFSCNHIIPDRNLIAIGCSTGPNNVSLNFSYSNRMSSNLIEETGRSLLELFQVIPKGVVVFFSSYDYQELLLNKWEKCGIVQAMQKRKKIFKESKKSIVAPNIFNQYKNYLKSKKENGAILFSVIGGKMSEGINFSDELARAVIVIGLPYANKNSSELAEKIAYLNSIDNNSGNEYYENLCMRAVNQSIGRAIRHIKDYAAIILIDERYRRNSTKNKLPDWIKSRFSTIDQFTEVKHEVSNFFKKLY